MDAKARRKPQRIWARRDLRERLRFFNGNQLQPERGVWGATTLMPSITKETKLEG